MRRKTRAAYSARVAFVASNDGEFRYQAAQSDCELPVPANKTLPEPQR